MPSFDRWLFLSVVGHRVHWLDRVMWALSAVGRGGQIWLATGAALALARRIRLTDLIALALAIALASASADTTKRIVNRERPFQALPKIDVIGKPPKDRSFPSGHSSNAFAGATVLVRAVPEAAVVWWTLAAAIAYSRVYLGVHYPVDVVGGAAIGWLCGTIAYLIVRVVRQAFLAGDRAPRAGTPHYPGAP
jgi:undecaprenyl-diphosphatase